MADLGDVLEALAALAADSLYPAGAVDAGGAALSSVAGPVVKIMRGTPFAKQLDADLRAGIVNVTVNERPGVWRVTTRLPMEWQVLSRQSPTISCLVVGTVLTLSGTVTPGQGVMLVVDGQPYAYQAVAGDDTASVTAALAALIQVDRPASSTGAMLTVPGAATMTARVVVQGTAIRPTRQQEAGVAVKLYAPSFASRDAVAAFVDSSFSAVARLGLPDGSVAMLRSSGTSYDDVPQKALTFVRTLFYQAEYSTTQVETETTIGVMEAILTPGTARGAPGPVLIATDVGPPRAPTPSDLAVEMEGALVQVDPFGNPEVAL